MSDDFKKVSKVFGYVVGMGVLGTLANGFMDHNDKARGLVAGIGSLVCLGMALKHGIERQRQIEQEHPEVLIGWK